ncbi:hypothetical protein BS47DRAFT_1336472 [Hydnum rufescens UP504]|uniref:Uncharacterized protein n=1 Tax=Hydnum rufescens UP504 TaxID=1448309 RepID=A0A9P6B8N6_9AGAM|nr:hypothetical protein BS47DRAFT_1336472 [Hydnum rufescens UP504]
MDDLAPECASIILDFEHLLGCLSAHSGIWGARLFSSNGEQRSRQLECGGRHAFFQ